MTDKKIKVLTISDHPLSPSGVGTQTKYMIEALLKTGKYEIFSLGGAVQHHDYEPKEVSGFEGSWKIQPVDGYGKQEHIRSLMRSFKPDMIWFMTDPRFWDWLWSMDNEIRVKCPLVYYHVWDNYPYPKYNGSYYRSNDVVVSISKVTHDIVNEVAPDVENIYHPHAVDDNFFKKMSDDDIEKLRKTHGLEDKFVFLWNNRNARRKMSGSLIKWYKTFCDKVGHDKSVLIMHTDPKDPYGQDLEILMSQFGLDQGQIRLSKNKVSPQELSAMYNVAHCTLNISDAEGFGLATLESLSCETPIVVTMTGGLQEQVTDGKDWFGIGIEPSSKALIGSQQVPYIYEDRVCEKDVVDAMESIFNMSEEQRKKLGKKGRKHVEKNYNFKSYEDGWVKIMDNIHEKYGSWENRKEYKSWRLININ